MITLLNSEEHQDSTIHNIDVSCSQRFEATDCVVPFVCSPGPVFIMIELFISNCKLLSVLFICRGGLLGPVSRVMEMLLKMTEKGVHSPLPTARSILKQRSSLTPDAPQKFLGNGSSSPKTMTVVSCSLAPGKLIIPGQGSNFSTLGSDSRKDSQQGIH